MAEPMTSCQFCNDTVAARLILRVRIAAEGNASRLKRLQSLTADGEGRLAKPAAACRCLTEYLHNLLSMYVEADSFETGETLCAIVGDTLENRPFSQGPGDDCHTVV